METEVLLGVFKLAENIQNVDSKEDLSAKLAD